MTLRLVEDARGDWRPGNIRNNTFYKEFPHWDNKIVLYCIVLTLCGEGLDHCGSPELLALYRERIGHWGSPELSTLYGEGIGHSGSPELLTLHGEGIGHCGSPELLTLYGEGIGHSGSPELLTLYGEGIGYSYLHCKSIKMFQTERNGRLCSSVLHL